MILQTPTISMQTFIKVVVVHGFLVVAFLFIAWRILKKNKTRLNVVVSLFYITIATGFIVNMIYLPFTFDPHGPFVLFLYYLTLFFLLLGTFYLTIFLLLLLETEKTLSNKHIVSMIVIYCIIDLCMVLIPNGVTINSTTSWNPVYSFEYFLYIIIIFSAFSVVPQIYLFLKIFKTLQVDEYIRRWRYFMLGIILLYIFCYGTVVYHYLDIQLIRTVWAYISLVLTITSAILIYYGLIKI